MVKILVSSPFVERSSKPITGSKLMVFGFNYDVQHVSLTQ